MISADWPAIVAECWRADHVPLPKSELTGNAGKRPADSVGRYGRFIAKRPTLEETLELFAGHSAGLCLLTGSVAGWFEVIDFDLGARAFDAWYAIVKDTAPGVAESLVWERTQRGGLHACYRWAYDGRPAPGGSKLAWAPIEGVLKTLIETRSEGNLIVAAPTPGYTLLQGDWSSLPAIAASDRDKLIEAARSLDETPSSQNPKIETPVVRTHDGSTLRPGDDFNHRGDYRSLLEHHGWSLVGRSGQNELWRRPGKTCAWSATFNGSRFIVHSEAAEVAPLLPRSHKPKGYDLVGLLAALEHGGNISAAASWLKRHGYGETSPRPDETVCDFSGILGIVDGSELGHEPV